MVSYWLSSPPPQRLSINSSTAKIMQAAPNPQPHQWTLRFKNHKLTILLLVEQQQSFTSIKSALLAALKDRGIAEIGGQTVPSDPDLVAFGIPVDKNDAGKGWVGVDLPASRTKDGDEKAAPRGSLGVLNHSPQGAGLKDGAMLAFKFLNPEAMVTDQEEDGDDRHWDVVMPTYEEDR